jgi:hypothetical protein
MTDDRDATLQILFANAEQDLPGEAFAADVMSQVGKVRHSAVTVWVWVGLVTALCVALLIPPLRDAVHLLTQSLTSSLITLDDRLLAQLLSPVNNLGTLLALGLIGLRVAYRKIVS